MKFIRNCILFLLLCFVIYTGIVFYQGHELYENVTAGRPVTQMRDELKKTVPVYAEYDNISPTFIQAIVSIEDQRFYSHAGIDIASIIRAVIQDIKTMSFEEGGSTITQQLAKNYYLTQEKKLVRKAAEVFLAFDIESTYSKDEILEMYVNTIYFGSEHYGITSASEGYYHCLPYQLNDYQATMLAGIPNAPSIYSLDVNPQLAAQRQRTVLAAMVRCGYLTDDECREILALAPAA